MRIPSGPPPGRATVLIVNVRALAEPPPPPDTGTVLVAADGACCGEPQAARRLAALTRKLARMREHLHAPQRETPGRRASHSPSSDVHVHEHEDDRGVRSCGQAARSSRASRPA